jgi:hypothetical protein
MAMFSTHPPLNERISRVDPGFRPEELERLAASILSEKVRERKESERKREQAEKATSGSRFDAGGLVEQIGSPAWDRMLVAAALAASLPRDVRRAAHSTEWAPEVLFYTLLDSSEAVREQQLLIIAQRMGSDSEAQVRALLQAEGLAAAEQRLPLLEMAFPALKRRPPDFITRVLDTVKALTAADGRVDVFEFLLARVISQHLWESHNPDRVRTAGRSSLSDCRNEALQLMAVLARHGQQDRGLATSAFHAGCAALDLDLETTMPATDDWIALMDSALAVLDRLKPSEKARLVNALALVVAHDGRMVAAELELLRAACALIHVPLPLFTQGQSEL